jgi:hypothetical protein
MSGKRASSSGWGPRSAALLVAASVAMVVWIAVGAAMLFAPHPQEPTVDQVAPTDLPVITHAPTRTPTVDGYSPSTYTGPLPTLRPVKAPSVTAHPAQTTAPSSPTTTATPTATPTHPGHGHSHGPTH